MVLFTRRRKMEGFRSPLLFGTEITLTKEVRYLGVTLDSRLNWKRHIEDTVKKTVALLFVIKRAVGSSPKVMMWIYKTIIRPRLAYGSVVWWPAAEKGYVRKKLASIQRLACIGILGAFRTAAGLTLDMLTGLPPLHVLIKGEAMQSCRRLRGASLWRGTGHDTGHTRILRLMREEVPIMDYIGQGVRRHIGIERSYEGKFPSRENWEMRQALEPGLQVYTDGSLIEEQGAGAGVCIPSLGVRKSIPLGMYTTVYQAEIIAIMEACRCIGEGIDPVSIYSDSQAAIKALTSYKVDSRLVEECRELLEELSKSRKVTLIWVPGHSGIEGNEEADVLAKEGAVGDFYGPEPATSPSKRMIRRLVGNWQIK